jgi:hypothetical protein
MRVGSVQSCGGITGKWEDGESVTTRQKLLLEIETAKMRHAWAKAEVKRGEPSAALVKYVRESLEELRALRSLMPRHKAVDTKS